MGQGSVILRQTSRCFSGFPQRPVPHASLFITCSYQHIRNCITYAVENLSLNKARSYIVIIKIKYIKTEDEVARFKHHVLWTFSGICSYIHLHLRQLCRTPGFYQLFRWSLRIVWQDITFPSFIHIIAFVGRLLQTTGIRFPAGVGILLSKHYVQTCSGVHLAAYRLGIKGSFSGGKVAGP
jgi:hypothetical protein